MKPTLLLSFAAAGLVAAQDSAAGLPSCARNCLSKMTSPSGVGGCKANDIACVCKNTSFLDDISCCFTDACNPNDQQKTIEFASTLCKASGVNIPDKIKCKKGDSVNSLANTLASGTAVASTGAATPLIGNARIMVGGTLVAILAAF